MKLAALLGGLLGGGLLLGGPLALRAFTSDPAAIAAAAPLLPLVAASQPINALAFVWDGELPFTNQAELVQRCATDWRSQVSSILSMICCLGGLVHSNGVWRLSVHLPVCRTIVTSPN